MKLLLLILVVSLFVLIEVAHLALDAFNRYQEFRVNRARRQLDEAWKLYDEARRP